MSTVEHSSMEAFGGKALRMLVRALIVLVASCVTLLSSSFAQEEGVERSDGSVGRAVTEQAKDYDYELPRSVSDDAQDGTILEEEDFTGIRVRNADIRGRVFIVSEREENDEYPARNVDVVIKDWDEEEVLSQTVTDRNGAYELPQLDVGEYWMYIGKLRLELRVVEDPEFAQDLPKVIIVMLPKDLVR